MRRIVRSAGYALLAFVVLFAGCAAPAVNQTPRSTPAGLLVFSGAGARVFKSPGFVSENFSTTLTDLDARTGAILWKSPAYAGFAIQKSVVIGGRAIFAIGKNNPNVTMAQPGTVTIYAADLTTGAITTLGVINQVLSAGHSFVLSLIKLNATTVALKYDAYQSATESTQNLLAFTSTLDAPVWRAKIPAKTSLLSLSKASVNGTFINSVVNGLLLCDDSTSTGGALLAARPSDGGAVWESPIVGYPNIDSDATHLYVTFSGQGGNAASIDSATGKTVWSRSWSGAQVNRTDISEPVVYNNAMYVGVTNYDANLSPTIPSTVYALSTTDGSTLWKQAITGWLQFPVETSRP